MSAPSGLGPIMQILVPVSDVENVQDLDGNNIGLMREAPKGLERG